MEEGLYFSTDTPLETNYIYLLDRKGELSQLASINSSSIYGCRVGTNLFFSTMVEPSAVNKDRSVHLYGADIASQKSWQSLLTWQKDVWPMRFFQYGNAFLPDGDNTTSCLALTTAAVASDDAAMMLYKLI